MEDEQKTLYALCFAKWVDLMDISDWSAWSGCLLDTSRSRIVPKKLGTLHELHGWMLAMEYRWPNSYLEFQAAFQDIRIILGQLLDIVSYHFVRSEKSGYYFFEQRSDDQLGYSDAEDDDWANTLPSSNQNYIAGEIEDHVLALAACGNHLIELANHLVPSQQLETTGKLEINYAGGPYGLAGPLTPELTEAEKEEVYRNWLVGRNEHTLMWGDDRFLQPDYIPPKHRLYREPLPRPK